MTTSPDSPYIARTPCAQRYKRLRSVLPLRCSAWPGRRRGWERRSVAVHFSSARVTTASRAGTASGLFTVVPPRGSLQAYLVFHHRLEPRNLITIIIGRGPLPREGPQTLVE